MSEKYVTAQSYEIISPGEETGIVFYMSVDPGSYVTPHWHDAVELVYMKEGTLDFSVEGVASRLRPGDIMLVNPQVMHSTRTDGNRAIVFQIPSELYSRFLPEFYTIRFHLDRDDRNPIYLTRISHLCTLLDKMEFLNDRAAEGDLMMFESCLYEVMFDLYHNFSYRIARENITRDRANLERLQKIFVYVDQHYTRPITLDEISGVVGLEKGYFCKYFKREMRETFFGYLNDVRISHIYQELVHSQRPIMSIIESNGFTSYKTFHKAFLARFGRAPSEVRRQVSLTEDDGGNGPRRE